MGDNRCAVDAVPHRIVVAAENLELAPGLSFTDDSSDSFPIQGDHLGDADLGKGRAAIVFFGASNCWNTNREAERLVAIYPKMRCAAPVDGLRGREGSRIPPTTAEPQRAMDDAIPRRPRGGRAPPHPQRRVAFRGV